MKFELNKLGRRLAAAALFCVLVAIGGCDDAIRRSYLLDCMDSTQYTIQRFGNKYRVLFPGNKPAREGICNSYEEAVIRRRRFVQLATEIYGSEFSQGWHNANGN